MAGPDQNDRTMIERVDPLLGTVLDGKYRLEFRLAAGGFGAIYRARDVDSNAELAVKIIHGRLASDPGVVARFRREGEALTALRSPHTITAYALGETSNGILYIAMELLNGVSLFERYRVDGPFPWRRMAAISVGVCHSLGEAHRLGIVHRDLKPTNIHLERRAGNEDFVKVLDFGIAKILQHSPFDNSDLTSAGLMIGTIDYMSPEQMVGGEITGASDLYTYGIVMYEMIAGRRPFPESSSSASALAAMFKPPPPLSSAAIVPAEMNRIVMRCLERDPEVRYRSADELAADLQDLLEPGEAPTYAYRRDEDATQISAKRTTPPPGISAPPETATATIMIAAAPPPPVVLPASAPPRSIGSQPAVPALPPPPRGRGNASQPPVPASVLVHTTLQMPPFPEATAPKPPTRPPGRTPTPPPMPAVRRTPTAPPMPATLAMPPVASPALAQAQAPLPRAPGAGPGAIPQSPVDMLRALQARGQRGGRREATQTAPDATVVDTPARRRQYDMAGAAQRDAMVRRLVWVCVLAIAGIIGLVVAMRL